MNKLQELNNNGFYKVSTNQHYSFSTVTFFNPLTNEVENIWTSDTEAPDRYGEEETQLYRAPINEAVREQWLDFRGIIRIGSMVKIVSGRKFKGEVKRVAKQFTYQIDGMYGRSYGNVEYLVFDDGTKVQLTHCELYK